MFTHDDDRDRAGEEIPDVPTVYTWDDARFDVSGDTTLLRRWQRNSAA